MKKIVLARVVLGGNRLRPQPAPSSFSTIPNATPSALGSATKTRLLIPMGQPAAGTLRVHAIYIASVWIHVLAAMAWVGGILFLVLVVVPWLHDRDRATAATFLRETGARFRNVAWACFAVLLTTGVANLRFRGVRVENFQQREWLTSPFGHAVVCKLALFALVLGLSIIHDFFVGPRASRAVEIDPNSPEAERLRRHASLLGRANAVLALLLVALGVILVRGWPV